MSRKNGNTISSKWYGYMEYTVSTSINSVTVKVTEVGLHCSANNFKSTSVSAKLTGTSTYSVSGKTAGGKTGSDYGLLTTDRTFTYPRGAVDATKTISFSVTCGGTTAPGTSKSSISVSVPALVPVTPTLSSNNVNIGDTITISTTQTNADLVYSLAFEEQQFPWGVISGISILNQGKMPVTIEVPEELMYASGAMGMSGMKSETKVFYVRCDTFLKQGGLVGTTYVALTVNVPDKFSPVFGNPYIKDYGLETGTVPSEFESLIDSGKVIQSLSDFDIIFDITNMYGADVSEVQAIINNRFSYGLSARGTDVGVRIGNIDNIINNVDSVLIITDSRTHASSKRFLFDIVPYNQPALNQIDCVQSDGKLDLKISGNISSVEGLNKCSLKIKYRPYGTDEYIEVPVYSDESIYEIEKEQSITNSSIVEALPYEIQVILSDLNGSTVKTIMTNVPTKLTKTKEGYMTFSFGSKGYISPYYQTTDFESYWLPSFDTGLSNNLVKILYDETLGVNVGYTSDEKVVYSDDDLYSSWYTISVSNGSINDICTGLRRVFCILSVSERICWLNNNKILEYKSLPQGCIYIVGNDTTLYTISQDGSIYYIHSLNDEWKEVVHSQLDVTFLGRDEEQATLKDYAPLYDAKFISTLTSLISIIKSGDSYKIIYTPTTSLR